MGAKDWLIAYTDRDARPVLRAEPTLDRTATRALVERLHPGRKLDELADGNLSDNANPDDGEVYAACFPGVAIVCTGEVAIDHPSRIDRRFLAEARGRAVLVHAMHSVVDWHAHAVWNTDGSLRRALSLSPDSGILENTGTPAPFETPFWAGERPVDDEYPLPFHPLELAEEVLRAHLGFTYEGSYLDDDPDTEEIILAGYRLT